MPEDPSTPRKSGKLAPTLYFIIAYKLLKGLLFASVALAAYMLSDKDLPFQFQNLIHWLRANPEGKFWQRLATDVGDLTEAKMISASLWVLAYSLFSLIEGVGLMFRIKWAGWLSIGEAAFFIPIEIYELIRRPSWTLVVVMGLNVAILWYLFQNRKRLFH